MPFVNRQASTSMTHSFLLNDVVALFAIHICDVFFCCLLDIIINFQKSWN